MSKGPLFRGHFGWCAPRRCETMPLRSMKEEQQNGIDLYRLRLYRHLRVLRPANRSPVSLGARRLRRRLGRVLVLRRAYPGLGCGRSGAADAGGAVQRKRRGMSAQAPCVARILWTYTYRLFRMLRRSWRLCGHDSPVEAMQLFRRAAGTTGLDAELAEALARSCLFADADPQRRRPAQAPLELADLPSSLASNACQHGADAPPQERAALIER